MDRRNQERKSFTNYFNRTTKRGRYRVQTSTRQTRLNRTQMDKNVLVFLVGKIQTIGFNTSAKSTVLNVISNPIVITFVVLLLCIIYQVFIMFRIRKIYRQVKNEAKKGNYILNGMLKRI